MVSQARLAQPSTTKMELASKGKEMGALSHDLTVMPLSAVSEQQQHQQALHYQLVEPNTSWALMQLTQEKVIQELPAMALLKMPVDIQVEQMNDEIPIIAAYSHYAPPAIKSDEEARAHQSWEV